MEKDRTVTWAALHSVMTYSDKDVTWGQLGAL